MSGVIGRDSTQRKIVIDRREAKLILDRVRSAAALTQETGRGHSGSIVIGLTETSSFAAPVTGLLKRAAERWPRVDFGYFQGRTLELVSALVEGTIDLAFIRAPAPESAPLQWRPLFKDQTSVALPIAHPLAERPAISIAALIDQPLILPIGRSGPDTMRSRIAAGFAKLGREPRLIQETPNYMMAINLVAAGAGLSLVPTILSGIRNDAVAYRPLRSTPTLSSKIIIVTRGGDPSPIVQNVLAVAADRINWTSAA